MAEALVQDLIEEERSRREARRLAVREFRPRRAFAGFAASLLVTAAGGVAAIELLAAALGSAVHPVPGVAALLDVLRRYAWSDPNVVVVAAAVAVLGAAFLVAALPGRLRGVPLAGSDPRQEASSDVPRCAGRSPTRPWRCPASSAPASGASASSGGAWSSELAPITATRRTCRSWSGPRSTRAWTGSSRCTGRRSTSGSAGGRTDHADRDRGDRGGAAAGRCAGHGSRAGRVRRVRRPVGQAAARPRAGALRGRRRVVPAGRGGRRRAAGPRRAVARPAGPDARPPAVARPGRRDPRPGAGGRRRPRPGRARAARRRGRPRPAHRHGRPAAPAAERLLRGRHAGGRGVRGAGRGPGRALPPRARDARPAGGDPLPPGVARPRRRRPQPEPA